MAECCIVGCLNKPTKRGAIKFYTLPTAKSSRPFKVKRRQLWLEAVEKANGSVSGLSPDAQICSAHFISGQVSLEISNQDFVPSVFPNQQNKCDAGSRRESLRPRIPPTEEPVVTPQKKRQLKQDKTPKQHAQSANYSSTEVDYCKPLEDEDLLEEKEKIPLSNKIVTTDFSLHKNPILLLKSIVDYMGEFQCDLCNVKFSNASMLIKHKQLHEQEWSDEETLPIVSEDTEKLDLTEKQINNEESSFKCNMCDRTFATIHNLKRHKLLHVRDARKCTQCSTLFCKRHNHVVVQPQISTETTFEEDSTADDINVSTESQMPECISEKDYHDDTLEMLLNSDSHTLEATAAAEEQSEAPKDTQSKPVPAVTCNPRKPDLLTAFKSFLKKKKKVETETVKPVTSTGLESTPPTASTLTKPVPEPSTSTLTPKAENAMLIIKSSSPEQQNQKIQQSTVCLSFSKPLPSGVLKEFMSYISKNECSTSTVPQLITFTANPTPAKPELATDQISRILKIEPATNPVALPTLHSPAGLIAAPQKQQSSFIASHTEPGPALKLMSPLSKPTPSTTVSSVTSITSALKMPQKRPALTPEYVHSSRPPSPVPILAKRQRGPCDLPLPSYTKFYSQPHLPRMTVLPPTLQMFSPQHLTSAMFDVKRNYEYILSKVT